MPDWDLMVVGRTVRLNSDQWSQLAAPTAIDPKSAERIWDLSEQLLKAYRQAQHPLANGWQLWLTRRP